MDLPPPPPLHSWINRTIGERQRYRIVSRLGGGGMGDVFLAIDTLLGQEVALKLLKEKLLGEGDLRKRFEREVLVCAALRSDHVVQVKDYGVSTEGYPYYVMEYLRGQTLGQLLRQEKRLSVRRSVDIVIQVCAGLHSAHTGVVMQYEGASTSERIHVVHRDLKPENIFLVDTTLGELVKILDFGIAKISHDASSDSTHTGVFMGTFQYASPEQLEGCKEIDGRADIYSLGMVLYEMLSGTDPFGFRQAKPKTGGVFWIRAHTSVTPKSLRSQPGCEHVPIELEAIVMKCLHKDPEHRFCSADDLYTALRSTRETNSASTQLLQPHPNSTVAYVPPGSQLKSEPQSTNFLPTPLHQQLEAALANHIGPIATIFLKQTLAQSNDYDDLIERLLKHLPAQKRAEFQNTATTIVQASISQILANDSDNAAKSAFKAPSVEVVGAKNINSNPSSNPSSLDPEFIKRCEQVLAEFIGPIANVIVKRAIEQKPSREQLIELLASKIPNPNQISAFRKQLS